MASDLGEVIDLHHHWIPREIIDTIEQHVPEPFRATRDEQGVIRIFDTRLNAQIQTYEPVNYTGVARRFELMDAAGIDVAVLSASCFPSWVQLKTARIYNDAAADLQREYGARLRPLIIVPPFGEPGILEEMERAARLGLRGVTITTNRGGYYPDQEVYLPFLKKAGELNLPIFVHAAPSPVHSESLIEHGLARTLGRSIDHCLTTIRMLNSGVMAGIPNLKMIQGHLGGAFFVNVKRLLTGPTTLMQESPAIDYECLLDRMLFDTAPSFWYGQSELECAVKNLGVHRVALGSDYPAGWDPSVLNDAVQNIRDLPLSDADKRRIAGQNAREFFGF